MMNKSKKHEKCISIVLLTMLFVVGFLIMMYPAISDAWNQIRTDSIVKEYRNEIEKKPSKDLEKEYQRARTYNDGHIHNIIFDVFTADKSVSKEYASLLDPGSNGIMGYIEIPVIRQRIVIYHGTSEEVLQKGCGHIAGTSLPVGGDSSHAVIAAHRGLPKAKLFTDLDQLKEGDIFYLFILDKMLAYEVDRIKVVEPDCLEELQIVEGKDYVTLFTCTPYSINSHRLLVRGHRIPYNPYDPSTQTIADSLNKYGLITILLVLLTMIIVLIVMKKRKDS